MNWSLAIFPSFEEGWPRRSSKCDVTLNSARPGRSNACCNKTYDLPRCDLFKVARHLLKGAATPPRRRGQDHCSNSFKPSKVRDYMPPTPTLTESVVSIYAGVHP